MRPPIALIVALAPGLAAAQEVVAPAIELELHTTIGTAVGPIDYTFGQIFDLATDGRRLFVLDGMSQEVSVFTPGGDFLRRFGGQGGGPSEFSRAMSIRSTAGHVEVFDMFGPNRLVTFDSLGAVVRTERSGFYRTVGQLESLGGELWAALDGDRLVYGEAVDSLVYSVVVFSSAQSRIDTLRQGNSGVAIMYEEGRKAYGEWANTDFGRAVSFTSAPGILVVVDGYAGRVLRYGLRGNRLMLTDSLLTGLTGVSVSDRDRRDALNRKLEARRTQSPNTARPRNPRISTPNLWAGIREVLLETDGSVWIEEWGRRESPSEPVIWRRYAPDLGYFERFVVPGDVRVRATGGGFLYGIRTDRELGFDSVVVFRAPS